MVTLTLLTGNPRKRKSLELALKASHLTSVKIETDSRWLPEIQAEDNRDVAAFAAEYGSQLLHRPVVKMDTAFFVEGLNNFPGPLAHSVDRQIGSSGFAALLKGLTEPRRARISNAVAYCEPDSKPVVFIGGCAGIVSSNPGAGESFIDKFFIPEHENNPDHLSLGNLRKRHPEVIASFWGNAETQLLEWLIDSGRVQAFGTAGEK